MFTQTHTHIHKKYDQVHIHTTHSQSQSHSHSLNRIVHKTRIEVQVCLFTLTTCALNFDIDLFCILAIINSLGFWTVDRFRFVFVPDLWYTIVWDCVVGFKRISKMPCIRSAEIALTHDLCSCLTWTQLYFIHMFNDKLLVGFVQSLLFDVQVFLTISPNHLCISVCVFCDDLCSIWFISWNRFEWIYCELLSNRWIFFFFYLYKHFDRLETYVRNCSTSLLPIGIDSNMKYPVKYEYLYRHKVNDNKIDLMNRFGLHISTITNSTNYLCLLDIGLFE